MTFYFTSRLTTITTLTLGFLKDNSGYDLTSNLLQVSKETPVKEIFVHTLNENKISYLKFRTRLLTLTERDELEDFFYNKAKLKAVPFDFDDDDGTQINKARFWMRDLRFRIKNGLYTTNLLIRFDENSN